MKLSTRLCLPLLLVAPLVALAQPKKPAPASNAASAPTTSDDGKVFLTNGKGGTSTYDRQRGVAHVTKNVVITQSGEELTVYAQDVFFDENTNRATATGQLRVDTRDSTIRGQRLDANFDDRSFTISGNVVITSHGKNDGTAGGISGELKKNPLRVLCDQVVWDYDTRQATATGNIRIVQEKRNGTCESIVYDEGRNIIELRGNAHFTDIDDQTFVSQKVRIDLDDDLVSSDERIRLIFSKDQKTADKTKAPTPKRTSKKPMDFGPAPTRPVLLGSTPLPTATPKPTATEEPEQTPRPDDDVPATDEKSPAPNATN